MSITCLVQESPSSKEGKDHFQITARLANPGKAPVLRLSVHWFPQWTRFNPMFRES